MATSEGEIDGNQEESTDFESNSIQRNHNVKVGTHSYTVKMVVFTKKTSKTSIINEIMSLK